VFATADARESAEVKYVSYGSVVKLQHVKSGYRLHSHEVAYGSGSGQQSVTATPREDDHGSFWVVKAADAEEEPGQGTPIPCGSRIRLEHLLTKKNLHSHDHASPYGSYEVSAYGNDGLGDSGDDFELLCYPDSSVWQRFATVSLRHIATNRFLQANQKSVYGQPIQGQIEVSATPKKSGNTQWKTNEGIYYVERD